MQTSAHPREIRTPLTLIGAAILALALAACEPEGDVLTCDPDGFEAGTTCIGEMTTSTGAKRTYRMHFPSDYDGQTPMPMVFNLPGLDQASDVHEWGTGMSRYADRAGFIVVYPDSLRMWYTAQLSNRDVLFLSELADELTDDYAVDSRRVYMTGISNGGAMAASMACERADQFAAFAPVVPVIGIEAPHYECDPDRRPVPMMLVAGGKDGFSSGSDTLDVAEEWAARNSASMSPEVITDSVVDEYFFVHPSDPDGDVEYFLVHNMAHTWPSESEDGFDGNAEVWAFLSQHVLP